MQEKVIETPLGRVLLRATDAGLAEIRFGASVSEDATSRVLDLSAQELLAYFAGELREFSTPIDPRGTDFQLCVWGALREIPFGQTRSYAQQAAAIGRPDAVRAVAAANGKNPLPIVVPCHRVIGSDGSLTGYAGGLGVKQALLELEGVLPVSEPSLFGPGALS